MNREWEKVRGYRSSLYLGEVKAEEDEGWRSSSWDSGIGRSWGSVEAHFTLGQWDREKLWQCKSSFYLRLIILEPDHHHPTPHPHLVASQQTKPDFCCFFFAASFRDVFIWSLYFQALLFIYRLKSRQVNPHKLTQLSQRSHPGHLVGKKDSTKRRHQRHLKRQPGEQIFPRWSPASLTINIYLYLFFIFKYNKDNDK